MISDFFNVLQKNTSHLLLKHFILLIVVFSNLQTQQPTGQTFNPDKFRDKSSNLQIFKLF